MRSLAVGLVFLFSGIALGGPPVTYRGPNNEIIGRSYRSGNTTYYRNRYNAPIGSYRNGKFYNSNGSVVGRSYGKK